MVFEITMTRCYDMHAGGTILDMNREAISCGICIDLERRHDSHSSIAPASPSYCHWIRTVGHDSESVCLEQ